MPPPSLKDGYVSLKDKIAPSFIEIHKDYVRIDNRYLRTIYVIDYPPLVDIGWLNPLLGYEGTVDVSIHLHPLNTEEVVKKLTQQLAYYRAQLGSDYSEGKVEDAQVMLSHRDAERLRLELQRGTEKLFQVGVYITLSAPSLEELNHRTYLIETVLGGMSVKSGVAYYQMEEGMDATLPLVKDTLGVRRNLSTSSLAAFFPFDRSVLTMERGILLGINLQSNTLVVFDPFARTSENANGVIIAKSGSGKSYAAKLLILRTLYQGARVVVVDPEREYARLCNAVGGSYIRFSPNPNETDYLNPFELPSTFWVSPPEERAAIFNDRIINLKGLLGVLLGKDMVTPIHSALIEETLFMTYAKKGITQEIFSSSSETLEKARRVYSHPFFRDFYRCLEEMASTDSGKRHVKELGELLSVYRPYAEGAFRELLNHPTNVNLDSRMVVFDLKDWEKDDAMRALYMQMVFGHVWDDIREKREKTLFVLDEAWLILQYPDAAQFVRSVSKRCRKYFCGLWVIVQDVEDLISSEQWRAILTNSSIQLLLKQSPTILDYVSEVFHLSEQEKWFLLNCQVGMGLVFFGGDRVPIRVVASEEEHYLITTNPLDLQEILEQERQAKAGEGIVKPSIKRLVASSVPIVEGEDVAKTRRMKGSPSSSTGMNHPPLASHENEGGGRLKAGAGIGVFADPGAEAEMIGFLSLLEEAGKKNDP